MSNTQQLILKIKMQTPSGEVLLHGTEDTIKTLVICYVQSQARDMRAQLSDDDDIAVLDECITDENNKLWKMSFDEISNYVQTVLEWDYTALTVLDVD